MKSHDFYTISILEKALKRITDTQCLQVLAIC